MEGSRTEQGTIFNIQHFSIQDGPGIRTTLFLKGCPLRCPWCSNPESVLKVPQIRIAREKCLGCGECIDICESGALTIMDGRISFDHMNCTDCMKCVNICRPGCISRIGTAMTVEETAHILAKDRIFYEHTKGGVTISGGEPLRQPEFLESLLRDLHGRGIRTALDTTGFAPPEIFGRILEHVDLLLYDVKHLDPELHRQVTGVDNGLILSNLMSCRGLVEIWLRIPLIPGFNGSTAFTDAVIELAREVGAKRCCFLPFHRWGEHKYARLGLKNTPARYREWEPGELDGFKRRYRSMPDFVFFENT